MVLVLTFAACGAGEGSEDESGSPEEAITEFSSDPTEEDGSFRAIHGHLLQRKAVLRGAALAHLLDEKADVRYAALYSLSLTAEPGAGTVELRPFLRSSDVSEQMLAAGNLAANGDKAALPVLIDALGSEERLAFRVERAWEFARLVLIQYTEEDFGLVSDAQPTPRQAAAAKPRWEEWWVAASSDLRWDAGAERFRAAR